MGDLVSKLVSEVPSVAAICVVVILFLKSQKDLINVIKNHIQHNTEALEKFRDATESLNITISELKEVIYRLFNNRK